MIILIDMDGVLADFEGSLRSELLKLFPEKAPLLDQERKTFKLGEQFPELEPSIKKIKTSPNFIKNLPLIPGSLEAIKSLQENHTIKICTSPQSTYKNDISERFEWIENHLGKEFTKDIITTKDKTLVKADILIDDKPEISGLKNPEWEHILFDQPYNRHAKNKKRINWQNYKEILKTKVSNHSF